MSSKTSRFEEEAKVIRLTEKIPLSMLPLLPQSEIKSSFHHWPPAASPTSSEEEETEPLALSLSEFKPPIEAVFLAAGVVSHALECLVRLIPRFT